MAFLYIEEIEDYRIGGGSEWSCAVVIGRESLAALHAVYALKCFYGVNGRARSSLLKMLCDEGDGVKGKWSVMEWSCGMELSDGV